MREMDVDIRIRIMRSIPLPGVLRGAQLTPPGERQLTMYFAVKDRGNGRMRILISSGKGGVGKSEKRQGQPCGFGKKKDW